MTGLHPTPCKWLRTSRNERKLLLNEIQPGHLFPRTQVAYISGCLFLSYQMYQLCAVNNAPQSLWLESGIRLLRERKTPHLLTSIQVFSLFFDVSCSTVEPFSQSPHYYDHCFSFVPARHPGVHFLIRGPR